MPDLTTVAKVKAWLGKTDANADALLGDLVTRASAFIASYCRRSFAAQAFSEIRDGSGGTELFLAHPPVSAVGSLTIDASPVPAQPADGQPGYFLVNGEVLALSGYVFTRGRKNVRVSYTGGYSTVPDEIAQACIEIAAAAYGRGQRGGPELESKSLGVGAETINFRVEDIPRSVRKILQQYRLEVPV